VLDDEFVSPSHGGFYRFLVQLFGCPQPHATWISKYELRELNPALLEWYLQDNSQSRVLLFHQGIMMQTDIIGNSIPEEIGNLEM